MLGFLLLPGIAALFQVKASGLRTNGLGFAGSGFRARNVSDVPGRGLGFWRGGVGRILAQRGIGVVMVLASKDFTILSQVTMPLL